MEEKINNVKKLKIEISTLSIIKVFVLLGLIWFFKEIKDVIVILFLAILFTSVIEPLVKWLVIKKFPKVWAVLLIYFVIFGFIGTIISLTVVPITEQIQEIGRQIPNYIEKLSNSDIIGFSSISSNEALLGQIKQGLQSLQLQFVNITTASAYDHISSLVGGFTGFIVIIVISFYLLAEEDSLKKIIKITVPSNYQPYLIQLFNKIQNKIGSWARAYLVMALVVWLLSFIVLTIFGIPYALVLSLIAAITEIVPMLGPLLAAIPAVIVAFFQSPLTALFVFIAYEAINFFESHILMPKVMQKAIGLNPVIIIIVVLIGAKLGGILGILLAIPITTALSVFVSDFFPKENIN